LFYKTENGARAGDLFMSLIHIAGTIAISVVSMNRAMAKVKDLTPRGTHIAISGKFAMAKAYSVPWFINQIGQKIRSEEGQPHWFSLDQWIEMT
jgi:hypothetical protein